MTTGLVATPAPIYPAYCHAASPTANKWVKLTAADVHALRAEGGYEGQNVYFHLNHPIQYVYLSGPVVAIDFYANRNGTKKWVTLTLDDSSGRTIEVQVERIVRLVPDKQLDVGKGYGRHRWATTNYVKMNKPQAAETQEADSSDTESEETSEEDIAPADQHVFKLSKPAAPVEPLVSDTRVANLRLMSICGNKHCLEQHVVVDNQILDIATVVKVKGTLQMWRGTFQIKLERIFIVRAADEESRIWSEYATFCRDVLTQPWQLSETQIKALQIAEKKQRNQAKEQKRAHNEKVRVIQEKRDKARKKMASLEAKAEEKRQAMVPILDGNPLDRVRPKPKPRRSAGSTKVRF